MSIASRNTGDTGEGDMGASASNNEFDTNLPTVHSYLGHMDNLHGYTLYDEGTELEMLGLYADTWVCPGHTLPLFVDYHREVDLMRQYITTNKTFVLICSRTNDATGHGITMEIIEVSGSDRSLALKAKGRQRCVIVNTKAFLTFRMCKVNIRILPDIEMSSPLFSIQLPSLNKKRVNATDCKTLTTNNKYRRYDAAQLRWPIWVYNQYEPHILTKKIQRLLTAYSIGHCAPSDPMKLSYWFLQNFQLNNDERLEILKLNSSVQRLKLELHYLQMKRLLCCAVCSSVIAKQSDVFAMSKDGIQTNYCNPGGHVYECLTVSDAYRFTLIGHPSEEFSWFPGYAWTIVQCAQCGHHLGWQFTSNKLKPKNFFGLAKNCINAKIIHSQSQKLSTNERNDESGKYKTNAVAGF